MKKLLALLMALVMLFCFAACSDLSDDSDKEEKDDDSATIKDEPITFEGAVVVDDEACTIKIMSIEPDDMFGYTLNAYFENKTESTNLMFSVTSASTNGVDNDPFFAASVDAGKKSNETITFSDTELEELLGGYTDICLSFKVYNNDDWSADPIAEPTIHIYPYGEEKATTYVRQSEATDTVLFDNDKVTAIVTGYEEDDIWGYIANVYLVNKTDTSVMFSADDVSVNGYMADPFFAKEVGAGCSAFAQISWSTETFEQNGITTVDEIELTMRAYDYNDWMADDFAEETVTLNP